ncbi:hypothetical protein ABZ297_05010 [Nonomuraea sp. NPDC005983]|uniref:hypothetical protein n=1 Tax=Nonomuraea sp. NPDC005983 TaxID=3155595 RepID=UPI0033A017E9
MNRWPELDGVPAPPPADQIVPAVLRASAVDGGLGDVRAHTVSAPRRAWQLLVVEARLLNPRVWAASFVVMAVCVGFSLVRGVVLEAVLSLGAPLVAGVGVAGLYGPERDRAFEVVAVTPTSPRVLLLARVTLVFGYDLALALLTSAVLAVAGGPATGVATLVAAWLGPMALLAGLSLLLSVCWHPGGATGVALAVWSVLALSHTDLPIPPEVQLIWSSGPLTLGLAGLLTAAAIALAGRVEPMRRGGATHRP